MPIPSRPAARRTAAVLLLLLAAAAPAARAQESVDLSAAAARALGLLKEHAGVAFDPAPPVRPVTADELKAVLQKEQETLQRQLLAPDQAKEISKKLAGQVVTAILGKYALEEKAVLVLPANLDRVAAQAGLDARGKEELLLFILIHELVHADQHQRIGLFKRIAAIRNVEDMMLFTAVAEGHAEFVSRRVGRAAGLSERVQAMAVRSSAGMPVNDAQQAAMAGVQETFHFVYVQGRAFFEHLHEAGGDAAVASALGDRWPADTSVILHPERFFRKEADGADWGRIFKGVDGVLEGWQVSSGAVGEALLRTGMSMYGFPKEKVDAALAGFVEGRMWTCRKGGKDLMLGVSRFRDGPAREAYDALDEAGTRLLIEKRVVTDFREAEIDLGGGRKGKESRYAMSLFGQSIRVYAVEFSAGAWSVGSQTMSEEAAGEAVRKAVARVAGQLEAPPRGGAAAGE